MKTLLLSFIKLYKLALSPYLSNSVCMYTPTCSEYAYEAITKKGIYNGIILSINRLIRCNPSNTGGYDPVPVESV
jgi:putative membrane protein insertion efficiency factor